VKCPRCGGGEFENLGRKYDDKWFDTHGFLYSGNAYRCRNCGLIVLDCEWVMNRDETRCIPRPCPNCGSNNVEFYYTEPDYGDAWKCLDCGRVFGGVKGFDNLEERPFPIPVSLYPVEVPVPVRRSSKRKVKCPRCGYEFEVKV